jgi:Na+/melibiose symporter-like transporter
MAVPVMKEAKMPVDNGAVTGYFKELCECYNNKSFQLFCASQFFDGCFNGVRAGFFVAYFFYVPKVIQSSTHLLSTLILILMTNIY